MQIDPIGSESGFNAFGNKVPATRIQAAIDWIESEYGCLLQPMERGFIVGCAVRGIEKDQPNSIFEDLHKRFLDQIGIYRLIAILCTDEATEIEKPNNLEINSIQPCECVGTRTINNGKCNKCGGYDQW